MSKREDFKPLKNLIGERFGILTVVDFDHKEGKGNYFYKCICDCGNECVKRLSYLKRTNRGRKSCGCWGKEYHKEEKTTHDLSTTLEYTTWCKMKHRCNCTTSDVFKYYGGRGIKVCDRWNDSFENFLEDMGERPSPQHTLDRIDVNGDYCPENCRWATRYEQSNNMRKTLIFEYDNKTQSLSDWCNELGINKSAIRAIMRRKNYTFEQAVEYYKKKGVVK